MTLKLLSGNMLIPFISTVINIFFNQKLRNSKYTKDSLYEVMRTLTVDIFPGNTNYSTFIIGTKRIGYLFKLKFMKN
jgi:hypothetical protein